MAMQSEPNAAAVSRTLKAIEAVVGA
ncbi:MAG: hypothetical protein RL030_581, partial [Pseudomonadota bacterium]